MNPQEPNREPKKPTALRARRIVLLASVAGLGAFALLAGPGFYRSDVGFGAPAAQAAETSSLPHPVGFAEIVAKVKPAVISVRVTIPGSAVQDSMSENEPDQDQDIPFAPGSPLQKFFQQFGDQFGQDQPQAHQTIIGEGSGFFISADGYAVTNNHVVDHAKSVQVTTADGTIYKAKVVGTDPKTDLALIKVDGKNDFPFVKFADQEPQVGDWVVAVGNPFGLGGTVTAGIVSAESRDIGGSPYDDYIQIDAPINKGNSGGPAFNVNGNVIGINTAIYSPSGGSVGIGFDIPAATAKRVVAELKEHGKVTRAWLGVKIQPVTAAIADSLGLKKAEGAIVDSAQAGSPAAKAGLQVGDVISAVNGTQVKDARDLARTIAMLPPDSAVKLDVLRQGESKTVSVTLATMPNEEQQASATQEQTSPTSGVPHLGVTVAPANEVAGAGERGVVVTAVDPNGPAAEAGLQSGTVILDVAGKTVGNAGDVVNALKEAKAQGKHDVLMRVKLGDSTAFVAVPLGNA
ncbi:MAG TPA: Do family serine endopeptidase [Xanthobacteraceae bacterium]|nr:Do family serine endopeptidase [Xanthobacteraceae bacterium]